MERGGYDHTKYLVSIDDIEIGTGLSFFTEIDSSIIDKNEFSVTLWDE
jgi:hypothetical protein